MYIATYTYIYAFNQIYTYVCLPGMGIIKSVFAVVDIIELIKTSHWYAFPISVMFSDGMMNESLYTNVELILLLAVTLLTLLTCVSPVVHMISTALVILPSMAALHCNIKGW